MYVISDLSVGGAEMMLYKLLAETDRTRFEPVVVSLMNGGLLRERIKALGVEVCDLGVKPQLPTPLDLWRLIRLTRKLRPDLVIGWMYHSCLAIQLASMFAFRRVPVLWSIHCSIDSLAREKWLTAFSIRMCALLSKLPGKIIFVSRDGQSKHRPLGFSNRNSCVIPNGIDAAEFVPSPEARASVRSELGLPGDALIIGMVSRYHPMKDHANFLRAAALVSKQHPETHFLLVGRGVDSDNRELCRLTEELGLTRRTHLLGERLEVHRFMAALDVLSLSSLYGESFPIVIGEAMACAVPCVLTDLGDASWIVGDTGRVVPTSDAGALADAWSEMINLGAEGRATLGRAARSRVEELFPVKSVVRRYETLYEAVLAGQAHESAAATVRQGQNSGAVS
jgi:glycosyltransferase involved in cell wall biosynthesis